MRWFDLIDVYSFYCAEPIVGNCASLSVTFDFVTSNAEVESEKRERSNINTIKLFSFLSFVEVKGHRVDSMAACRIDAALAFCPSVMRVWNVGHIQSNFVLSVA